VSAATLPENQPSRTPGPLASGPGRVLVAVYGIFALAATSRAGVQIATKWHDAPLAYALSAFSAVVYVLAAVALASRRPWAPPVALVAVTIELIGVLVIGTFSLVRPDDFRHPTVWSLYGQGYGYVPLVLPLLGLWWLRRNRTR
jgi:hypothetical protein